MPAGVLHHSQLHYFSVGSCMLQPLLLPVQHCKPRPRRAECGRVAALARETDDREMPQQRRMASVGHVVGVELLLEEQFSRLAAVYAVYSARVSAFVCLRLCVFWVCHGADTCTDDADMSLRASFSCVSFLGVQRCTVSQQNICIHTYLYEYPFNYTASTSIHEYFHAYIHTPSLKC